jgi:hypothetical protein
MNYSQLPLLFLKFWFIESPVTLFQYFASLNMSFLQLFSLPLFLQTYFKPLKNEYRQGLVGFSRALGIFIKTILIAVDIFLFTLLLAVEVIIFAGYVFLPIATIWVLFL